MTTIIASDTPCTARTEQQFMFTALCDTVAPVLGYRWHNMVYALGPDTLYDGITYFGLEKAPAAKGNHHHYLGGLVAHVLEMWDIHNNLAGPVGADSRLPDDRVLAGILLHDLHKAWCHFVQDASVPSGFNYGKHPSSNLMTPDQKTVYIASKYVQLDIVQLNAVYHSEGGWAASPPRWSTPLSKYVYLLDELSSNVRGRLQESPGSDSQTTTVYADKGVTVELHPNFELYHKVAR